MVVPDLTVVTDLSSVTDDGFGGRRVTFGRDVTDVELSTLEADVQDGCKCAGRLCQLRNHDSGMEVQEKACDVARPRP